VEKFLAAVREENRRFLTVAIDLFRDEMKLQLEAEEI
jgi:hypothetical protein